MDQDSTQALLSAASTHNWPLALALGLHLFLRVVKEDIAKFPLSLSQRAQMIIVAFVSAATGGADSYLSHVPASQAAIAALLVFGSGLLGVFSGAKSVDTTKASQGGHSSVWAMGLAVVGLFGLVAFMHGCAWLKKEANTPVAHTIRDAALIACQVFAQDQAGKMGISLDDAIHIFCSSDQLLEPWLAAQSVGQRVIGERISMHLAAHGLYLDAGVVDDGGSDSADR